MEIAGDLRDRRGYDPLPTELAALASSKGRNCSGVDDTDQVQRCDQSTETQGAHDDDQAPGGCVLQVLTIDPLHLVSSSLLVGEVSRLAEFRARRGC